MLGPIEVLVDGRRVELGSAKQRAVLALLMLTPDRVVPVDRLVDQLWGDRPPGTAKHALQVYVSGLRKALHGDSGDDERQLIVTERPGYRLRIAAENCDAKRFERLAGTGRDLLRHGDPDAAAATLVDALSLWRGSVLADLAEERFAQVEASRLEELRLAAIEDRVEADLARGRHREVAAELDAMAAEHPLRERTWALRMLALYRSGRRAEALRAYSALRAILRDELGLEPSSELQALEIAILNQADELTWRPPVAAAAPPAAAAPAPLAAVARSPAAQDGSVGAAAPPVSAPTPIPPPGGQRRVATVLFADMEGFTGLVEDMDPEDVTELVDRSMRRFGDIVVAFGGTVANVVGDELMAIFGAPVAHEDDAERAVRAGLEIQRVASGDRAILAGLRLRVGINTGDVMYAPVGPREHPATVMGDAVNTAKRIEAAAEPGCVYVGEQTWWASRTTVRYRRVGARHVKGRREALMLYEALDVSAVPEARRQGGAPLIGRAAEIDLLERIWRRAVNERRPHLVSILGEPGIGKSRLTAEFERIVGDGARFLHGRCLPYGEALSYWALSEALKEAVGVDAGDSDAAARAKLRAAVASVEPDADAGDLLARHLALLGGFDEEHDRAAGAVDARTLHGSARRFLGALARRHPVCLVVEDIHWADDALLDLVDAVMRTRDAPLVVLTQSRPELLDRRPAWGGGHAAFSSVILEPLDRSSTEELVGELGRAHGLAPDVLREIADLTGGNPLFAEELVATVAERGADAGVPRSLRSLLLARIDALPEAEQAALRLGSVFGITFWEDGIRGLAGDASGDVAAVLEQLEWRDLVHEDARSDLAGHVQYTFKHVLIRDAAYETLPRASRRELHRRAGDWLAGAAAGRADDYVGALAHHAVEAGEPERAVRYLVAAAERANRAAAHRREAALLAQAIALAEAAPVAGPPELVPELRLRRGQAFFRVGAWAEARAELELAIADLPPSESRRRGEALVDLGMSSFWLLDTPGVRKYAEQAVAVAERHDHDDIHLIGRALLANADSADGEVEVAIAKGRAVIADARALGLHPPFNKLASLPLQLYLIGNADEAIEVSREALSMALASAEPAAAMWQLPQLGLSLAAAGRYAEAAATFAEARRFGVEYEVTTMLPRTVAMAAGFRLDVFDFAGAQAIQEEARDLARSVNFPPTITSAGIDLVLNLVRQGEIGRAQRLADEVGRAIEGAGGWHGWLWRLRFAQAQAELALGQGDPDRAAVHAADAIAQSRAKLRRKYELLGRLTLGQALAAMGRTADGAAEVAAAAALGRDLRNPALLLKVHATRAALDPDADVTEARALVDEIAAALPDDDARKRFLDAGPVRLVLR